VHSRRVLGAAHERGTELALYARVRTLFLLAFLVASAAAAQPRDERIVLDAAEKHIVRDAYHDDQAVVLQGAEAGGWRLYAGAAVDARRIDLTLRNVRGEVRFRADTSRLEALLRRDRRALLRQLR
jgi:hypothetical protein